MKEKHIESKTKNILPRKRFQKWKDHFKNLLVNSPEIIDKSIEKIINS